MSLEKLSREHYSQIGPLFSDLRYNLGEDSILDGNTPTWVFADRVAQPGVALMWNRMDAVLLGVGQTSIDDVHNYQIASWCLSVYTSGNHYELGLETAGDFRQKGFATATAAEAVKYCDEEGFVPDWHCWNDNVGSIAVAQKVGFFSTDGLPCLSNIFVKCR